MKFIFHKKEKKLFTLEKEIKSVKFDEKNNPYFVFADCKQHWIKFYLTRKGNLKKIFYKKVNRYYLREFARAKRQNVIIFQFTKNHQVEKQLSGWEPVHKKYNKPNLLEKN